MPRKARVVSPTGFYHIMVRGIDKEPIFSEVDDKFFVLHLSSGIFKENEVGLSAYCIMDNHIHFLLNGIMSDISKSFFRINLSFARRYNHRKGRVGHVFQNRFLSESVDSNRYLLHVLRYIHQNPVKAQMVASPELYSWSSYQAFLPESSEKPQQKDLWIAPAEKEYIFAMFDDNPNEYRRFHKEVSFKIHLDTYDDIAIIQKQQLEMIVRLYLNHFGLQSVAHLTQNKLIFENTILSILELTAINPGDISAYFNVSKNVLYAIYKNKAGIERVPLSHSIASAFGCDLI